MLSVNRVAAVETLSLEHIPNGLVRSLIDEYLEIKKRFSMNDWGPGQLKGGRYAEAILRIFQHLIGETVTIVGTDIPNVEKTRILNLIQNHPKIDEHVRQKIVPMTRLLLDFRNNRDSAHLGGFVANSMDTLYVMSSATWILAEFIRVYGRLSMNEAQRLVDTLAVKEYPVMMEYEGEIFITRPGLTSKEEVLILLYRQPKGDFDFLFSKTRDSNVSRFRETLADMVKSKLVGVKNGEYFLMPQGSKTIEKERLLSFVD